MSSVYGVCNFDNRCHPDAGSSWKANKHAVHRYTNTNNNTSVYIVPNQSRLLIDYFSVLLRAQHYSMITTTGRKFKLHTPYYYELTKNISELYHDQKSA